MHTSKYLKIWECLLPLSHQEINTVMGTLKKWVSSDLLEDNRIFPMNDFQLKQLQIDQGFSLGMNTVTHSDLSTKKTLSQLKEIHGSKYTPKKNHGIKPNMLAYPYGKYNQLTTGVVCRLNIAACFTTDQETVNADTDVKMPERFQVLNWMGEVFRNQLNV
jgi:peptidoglycan/xylan/chitin deacetylase (PgdA/CDA1 family)